MSCNGLYTFEKQLNSSFHWIKTFDESIKTEYLQLSFDFDSEGFPVVILIESSEIIKITNKFILMSNNSKNFSKIQEIGVWVNNLTDFSGIAFMF